MGETFFPQSFDHVFALPREYCRTQTGAPGFLNAYCVWKLFFLTFHCLRQPYVKADPLLNSFFGKGCPVEWLSHHPWRYGPTGRSVWSPAPRSLQSCCHGQERQVGVSADPRSRAETAHFTCYGAPRRHREPGCMTCFFPKPWHPVFPAALTDSSAALCVAWCRALAAVLTQMASSSDRAPDSVPAREQVLPEAKDT